MVGSAGDEDENLVIDTVVSGMDGLSLRYAAMFWGGRADLRRHVGALRQRNRNVRVGNRVTDGSATARTGCWLVTLGRLLGSPAPRDAS